MKINRPLRCLHILTGKGRAGSTLSVLLLVKGLQERGNFVFLGVSPHSCTFKWAKERGLDPLPLFPRERKKFFLSLNKLLRLIKKEKIQILNTHLSWDRRLALALKLIYPEIKVVLTRRSYPKSLWLSSFFSNLLADRIIAVSEGVKEKLIHQGIKKEKIEVIQNGIDLKSFSPIPPEKIEFLRKTFNLSPSHLIIGIVGRFDPLKGHEVLFQALPFIEGEWKVLVVGGNQHPEVERLKEEIKRRIIFCGFQEDIAPFYQVMDVLVLPSYEEGFPLTLLEAMASGVPVIGTRIGGTIEIIKEGENGFLFSPGNSRELVEKLNLLLKNSSLREKFSREGRKRVKEFSIEKTVEKTERLYRSIL